jgi:hypothetical protein
VIAPVGLAAPAHQASWANVHAEADQTGQAREARPHPLARPRRRLNSKAAHQAASSERAAARL